jgi:hypothetical protein
MKSGMRRTGARIILAMQTGASRVAAAALLTASISFLHQSAAACPVNPGQPVVLASQELDPDVFLWDSSRHLTGYAQGDYDVASVLKHTTLIRAYTNAVVTGCRNVIVHSPLVEGADPTVYLVSVRVTTGANRGRYGWVVSSDIRSPNGRELTPKRRP